MKSADLFDIRGQVALVTGASSGLGARFARVLAANGARLALVARRSERLAAVRREIEAVGGLALTIEADVLDRQSMLTAYDRVADAWGTVTILVNNAGITHSSRAIDLAPEDWHRVIATNLDAVFFWAQEGAKRMLAAKTEGAIVNIASVLGLNVAKGVVAYTTAKAGVIQVTRALAVELGFNGIRVNAIAPGWFVTELNTEFLNGPAGVTIKKEIPVGRFGQDGDLDGALLLLVSKAGNYINGATFVVDGGQSVVLRG